MFFFYDAVKETHGYDEIEVLASKNACYTAQHNFDLEIKLCVPD